MADQAVAQSGAVKKPVAQRAETRYRLVRKVSKALKAGRCWVRYWLVGWRSGVPGLVDFVVGNYFFMAMQVPSELATLGDILTTVRPKCALEIGTCRGGTLLMLCRLASPQATIISLDLPGGQFGGGYGPVRGFLYERFARRAQRLQLLQGDSHNSDMADRVKAALRGQALDYLFIDGDHSYRGVKRDFDMYGPMVRKGGLIAFHDIVDGPIENVGGVPRFWREIKSQYRHMEIIKDRQQGGWGIGVLFVD